MKKENTFQKFNVLLWLTFALMVVALYFVFIYAPDVKDTNLEQRIFYFHVPVAVVSYLAFFIIFISSILYLRKREAKWDNLARCSAEIGLIFTSLVLITGPIWAKPAWGTWWVWEPRLTTSLILWLIYIAYLMVRSFATEESQGARFAAVVGIVGFIDVPINYLAIRLWNTQHPVNEGMNFSIFLTLLVCMAAIIVLFILLLKYRVSLRQMETELNDAKIYLDEIGR